MVLFAALAVGGSFAGGYLLRFSDDVLKAANLAGGVQSWVREEVPFEDYAG